MNFLFYVGIIIPTVITISLFVIFIYCWFLQKARKEVLTRKYDPHGKMRLLGMSMKPPLPPRFCLNEEVLLSEIGEDNIAYDVSRSPSTEQDGRGRSMYHTYHDSGISAGLSLSQGSESRPSLVYKTCPDSGISGIVSHSSQYNHNGNRRDCHDDEPFQRQPQIQQLYGDQIHIHAYQHHHHQQLQHYQQPTSHSVSHVNHVQDSSNSNGGHGYSDDLKLLQSPLHCNSLITHPTNFNLENYNNRQTSLTTHGHNSPTQSLLPHQKSIQSISSYDIDKHIYKNDNRLFFDVNQVTQNVGSHPLHDGKIGSHPLHDGKIGSHPLHDGKIGSHPLHDGKIGSHPLHDQFDGKNKVMFTNIEHQVSKQVISTSSSVNVHRQLPLIPDRQLPLLPDASSYQKELAIFPSPTRSLRHSNRDSGVMDIGHTLPAAADRPDSQASQSSTTDSEDSGFRSSYCAAHHNAVLSKQGNPLLKHARKTRTGRRSSKQYKKAAPKVNNFPANHPMITLNPQNLEINVNNSTVICNSSLVDQMSLQRSPNVLQQYTSPTNSMSSERTHTSSCVSQQAGASLTIQHFDSPLETCQQSSRHDIWPTQSSNDKETAVKQNINLTDISTHLSWKYLQNIPSSNKENLELSNDGIVLEDVQQVNKVEQNHQTSRDQHIDMYGYTVV